MFYIHQVFKFCTSQFRLATFQMLPQQIAQLQMNRNSPVSLLDILILRIVVASYYVFFTNYL